MNCSYQIEFSSYQLASKFHCLHSHSPCWNLVNITHTDSHGMNSLFPLCPWEQNKEMIMRDDQWLGSDTAKVVSLVECNFCHFFWPMAFPADMLLPHPDLAEVVWRRPHEISDNPKFIVGSRVRFDVDQHKLGDCWWEWCHGIWCHAHVLAIADQSPKGKRWSPVPCPA